jgi:hypothetical protein
MAVANSARIGNIDGYRFIGCLGFSSEWPIAQSGFKAIEAPLIKFIVVLPSAHWSKPGKPARISAEKSGALSAA